MELPVVILAGGLGTRLREISQGLPKALVPIAGKPFIHWKLDELHRGGATCIYLLLGVGAIRIIEYISSINFSIPISFILDGPEPIGTAAALNKSLDLINSQKFVLTYGDNLLDFPVNSLKECMNKEIPISTMVLTENLSDADTANARFIDSMNISYSKTSQSEQFDYCDYGYTVIDKSGFTAAYAPGSSDLNSVFEFMSRERLLHGLRTDEKYREIGTPSTYSATEKHLLKGQ